jgi:O-acetyl-ADP-ribose deacetylase (regulator of RNase III)
MITYQVGDATNVDLMPKGNKIICHICNDAARWGSGFVLSLRKRWPRVETEYRNVGPQALGTVQYVNVGNEYQPGLNDTTIANMIAQHNIQFATRPPIRYVALAQCLLDVRRVALLHTHAASIHMPMIGSGLAGGNWEIIDGMIEDAFEGIDVTIYKFVDTKSDSYVGDSDIEARK